MSFCSVIIVSGLQDLPTEGAVEQQLFTVVVSIEASNFILLFSKRFQIFRIRVTYNNKCSYSYILFIHLLFVHNICFKIFPSLTYSGLI